MNSNIERALSTALAAFGLLFPLFSKRIFGRRKIADRISVVIANVVPITGMLLLQWSALEVLFYYFLELCIYLSFHSLSASIAPFLIFWERLKDYRWYEKVIFYPLTWPFALLTAITPVVAGFMFLFLLTPVYKVIHFLAERSGQTETLLSLKESYTHLDLSSSFFITSEFLMLLIVGLYLIMFFFEDHKRNFSIVVGDLFEDDNIIILLFWGPLRAFADRIPLLLLAFFVTVILGGALYALPEFLMAVIGLRLSLQLYLLAYDLRDTEMPARLKAIIAGVARFKNLMVYGFIFGYNRKLELEIKPKA